MNKKLIPLIAVACLGLVGCRENGTDSTDSNSGSDVTNTGSDVTGSESSGGYESVEWNPEDEVMEGGITGAFIDAAVGIVFTVGYEYRGSVSFGDYSTVGATVTISNNGVAEASIDDSGMVTFKGLKEGESIICVYDSTGFLYYRNCLSFRKALDTQAAITDFIVNEVDHYTSVAYPGMHISFLAGNSGMVYGSDEGIGLEPAITFAYDYRGIVGTEHHLVVTDWQNQTYSSLTITDIYIEVNGYTVHPMTSGGVVDFFTPVFTE